MDYEIRTLIPEEELIAGIRKTAEKINRDYQGGSLRLICLLKGGVFFLTELAKYIEVPVTVDFMSVSSYGAGTVSSGVVRIIKDLDDDIVGKDVLVVEDIIDTGNTLSYVLEMLKGRNPASLRLCTLLDKPERRQKDVKIDYEAFTVPDRFIVGFGLDYDQKYRNLPYIGEIVFQN